GPCMRRPVPHQLLRNDVLDLSTIVSTTACHRRSYAERYSRFIVETPCMRTLKLHFPDDALSTLDTFVKQTKEARVFRRAQAVRNVVKGQRLQTVSDALSFPYSALRKWVNRFASQGVQGLLDRPRSGRPPKITCALEQHLNRLV